MFKLKETSTFWWPCKARVPDDGKFETVKFEAEFQVLSQDEISAILNDAPDDESGGMRVLDRALINYKGIDVEDDSGDEVTDPDERKAIILRYPYFVKALSDGFAAGISGYKAKN